MRVLGIPLTTPDVVLSRVLSDLAATAQMARNAPAQLDRLLELGEEMTQIGQRVLELGERIDSRAEAVLAIGERIEARAEAILTLGETLDDRAEGLLQAGDAMREMAEKIDARGAEIVDSAARVATTGGELIGVIPTLERAMEMATPLEGAIDRFGRLVDRLPGGGQRRRTEGEAPTARRGQSNDPPEPPAGEGADQS